MPTYILLSTLTPEGRQTLLDHPDRIELVNKEISDLGCKVIVSTQCSARMILSLASKLPITRPLLICRLA